MPNVAAIVYGERSGIVRRVVVFENGISKLVNHYGVGESVIIVSDDEVLKYDGTLNRKTPDLTECYIIVEAKRGVPSESDRCVVIDNTTGKIDRVVLSDPYLESEQKVGKTLFQHPEADEAWVIGKSGEYEKPLDVVDIKRVK